VIYHGIYLLVPSASVAVLACNLSCIREVIRLRSNISWAAPAGLPLVYWREHPARHDPLSFPDSECLPTISTSEVVQSDYWTSHWCRLGHAKKKHGPGSSLASPGDEDSREIFYGVVNSLHALAFSGLGRIGGGLLGIRDWHRRVDTCDLQWRDAAPPFSPTRCVWTPSTRTVLTTPLRRCGIPRCAFVMPVSNLTSRLRCT
jgi:hypothetical protein